jgi:hypothetical protein
MLDIDGGLLQKEQTHIAVFVCVCYRACAPVYV